MNIELFKSKMADASIPDAIDESFMESTVKGALRPLPDASNTNGALNLIIIMEEFSELLERIAERNLYMPDEYDDAAFLEEIADTYLSFEFIRVICRLDYNAILKGNTYLYNNQPKSMAKITHILSKMTQWTSKHLRKAESISNDEIIDLLASAYRELNLIEAEYGFTKEQIAKAINIKLIRQAERNSKTSW